MRWKQSMRFSPIDNNDGTHLIPLGNDRYSVIDSADLPKIAHCCWCASRSLNGKTFYAKGRATGSLVAVGMHRVILCFPLFMIDHINGNGLDNRRCNLRLATARENNLNHPKRKGSSAFRGVHRVDKGWEASIRFNYRLIRLGRYAEEKFAAAAYDVAARVLNGEFAMLNGVPSSIEIRLRVKSVLRQNAGLLTHG